MVCTIFFVYVIEGKNFKPKAKIVQNNAQNKTKNTL